MKQKLLGIEDLLLQIQAYSSSSSVSVAEVVSRQKDYQQIINQALICDRHRLQRSLSKLVTSNFTDASDSASGFLQRLSASIRTTETRKSLFGQYHYPENLPVSQMREKIAQTLMSHQVIIVAGETGSGKTTQLPKICAEFGRGIFGRIGHTQPRRIAARAVAARIAEELGVELGEGVGFQFRFNNLTNNASRIKVMTDGILLAEIPSDKLLLEYDTLIIDEAHERSLNIDFLLGYIKTLLPRRPDLKVIITSATIDVDRFSAFFNDAPVIAVEGRSFPVHVEYLNDDTVGGELKESEINVTEGSDLARRVLMAIDALEADHKNTVSGPRDVLVFLPGEREIRDVSLLLRRAKPNHDILPLYARLSQKEQQRVFGESRNQVQGAKVSRRIVLATNVAETSITVPGIGYVVDPGLARVNRFSSKSKLQKLAVEAISKASAKQRAGRCGRLAPGICYRLYSEEDFENRDDFTQPEILRTQLASVILQMKWFGLADIRQFPFIQPPEDRQIKAGLQVLVELGAIDSLGKLTSIGKRLASLPVDPRLGRMLISGIDNQCIVELLVIVSALAVQDPREFPAEKRQIAQSYHGRFYDHRSDFLLWVNLWIYYQDKHEALSQNQLRKLCAKEYLSYVRLREWRDMHRQLVQSLSSIFVKADKHLAHRRGKTSEVTTSLSVSTPRGRFSILEDYTLSNTALKHSLDMTKEPTLASQSYHFSKAVYEKIHRALLMGIPLQVGSKAIDKKHSRSSDKLKKQSFSYRGVRNLQFHLFPGSSQFKKTPQWVLAGEIVETAKVYARSVAEINPDWLVGDLSHLIKHEYTEPHWQCKRGQVVALRNSTLYGLPVKNRQPVAIEKMDRVMARNVFIQEALVQQQLEPDRKLAERAFFWRKNTALIDKVKALEERVRRRDLLISDDSLKAFYDQHLPEWVCSRATLWQLLDRKSKNNDEAFDQNCLLLKTSDVLLRSEIDSETSQFPQTLSDQGHVFTLSYRFSPGQDDDGVTAQIPLEAIAIAPIYLFDWLVPGMLYDKCVDMIKLLPKTQRKHLVPVPAVTERLLASMSQSKYNRAQTPLAEALAAQVRIAYGVDIDPLHWRAVAEQKLDNYCRMRFEIVDHANKVLRSGRALETLQRDSLQEIDQQFEATTNTRFDRENSRSWDFGELSVSVSVAHGSSTITGFPVLIDTGEAVNLELASSQAVAEAKSREGLLRLAILAGKERTRFLRKQLKRITLPVLPYVKVGSHEQLIDDVIKAAVADACFDDFVDGIPRTEQAFNAAVSAGAGKIIESANEIECLLHEVLQKYHHCCEQLQQKQLRYSLQCCDIKGQLDMLIFPGFLREASKSQLEHFPRYLQAILLRFDQMGSNNDRDAENCEKLATLYEPMQNLLYKYPHALIFDKDLNHFRWMLEELRVSLFAQQLKTRFPVSFQRVAKAWNVINLNQYPLLT